MNNNVKRPARFRFNFIDVILIAVILIAALALVWLLRSENLFGGNSNEQEITYQIFVRSIREEFRNKVSVGDKVVDAVQLAPIGEVVDVSYVETPYTGINRQTQEMVYSTYPGFLDMTVTVRAKATSEENGYQIEGFLVSVGSSVAFRVPHFTADGFCLAVSENS